MLPSPLPSAPLQINVMILMAYKRAGLLPVEATLSSGNVIPKLEHGRLLLDTILDSLQTEGYLARTLSLHDLTIVAGEPFYTLPDTVLDAYGDAMFIYGDAEDIDPKRTNGEVTVKQVDVATWQALSTTNNQSSWPQLYAAFRDQVNVQVRLWPSPSDNGVLRLKIARLFGGNQDGKRPVDLQRYWQDALIWMLAYYIATDSSVPTERCVYLAQVSEAKKTAALRYGMEQTTIQATVAYSTQWST